ncbi:MAG: hypothetical protein JWN81_1442, partial [Solirubrobacterales bacterium]|nr:hypothetical protein [Solirubrobacterales bacterium]
KHKIGATFLPSCMPVLSEWLRRSHPA